MKVLVPVKRVIDYNVKPRVKPDGSGVDLANARLDQHHGSIVQLSGPEAYACMRFRHVRRQPITQHRRFLGDRGYEADWPNLAHGAPPIDGVP